MIQSIALMRIVFLVSFLSTSETNAYTEKIPLSQESVPLSIAPNSVHCADAFNGGGFIGYQPGMLWISEDSIFDRTLRVADVHFFVELPRWVNCDMLKDEIRQIPQAIEAKRNVYRVIEETFFDRSKMKSSLVEEVLLKLPVRVNGVNVVLVGTREWLEEMPLTHELLPRKNSYVVKTHPQSASYPVGLFCKPLYPQAVEHQLSLGQVSGYLPDKSANNDLIAKTFVSLEACEETRSHLLKRYAAEDPDNWGTRIRVERTLESVFRHILDNQGNSACQEIQVESLAATIQGMKLTGVKASFPVRTVNLALCG